MPSRSARAWPTGAARTRPSWRSSTSRTTSDGHGHAACARRSGAGDAAASTAISAGSVAAEARPPDTTADVEASITHALEAGNRIGFIYQKLQEPRSYDFEKTENKRYNERLRMPQFPFTLEEREAVITFVLGLVADPPRRNTLSRQGPQRGPDRRPAGAGEIQLRRLPHPGAGKVADQLSARRIRPAEPRAGDVSVPASRTSARKELAAAATPDQRNELHATLAGLPPLDKTDGLPIVFDDRTACTLDRRSPYAQRELQLRHRPVCSRRSSTAARIVTGQSPVSASHAADRRALSDLGRRADQVPAAGGDAARAAGQPECVRARKPMAGCRRR